MGVCVYESKREREEEIKKIFKKFEIEIKEY